MNTKLKTAAPPELYAALFASDAYKDFMPKYCSLLLGPMRNTAGGSGPTAPDINRDPDLIEAAATDVAQLIPQAFRLFKLIAERPGGNITGSDYNLMQTALHEAMLKTLYHINRNCRTLLDAQVDYEKFESIGSYLRALKKKHGITDMQMLAAFQKWHEPDEALFYNLVEREHKMKALDAGSDGVCFQIYGARGDEVLQVPREMRTDNGQVISRRYFFHGIFQVFQHLQICTQLCELEKAGAPTVETIAEAEVGMELMEAFHQAAKVILCGKCGT